MDPRVRGVTIIVSSMGDNAAGDGEVVDGKHVASKTRDVVIIVD